jgi:hypothetical protein
MTMLLRALLLLGLWGPAGCIPPRGPSTLEEALRKLSSQDEGEYEEGFQAVLAAGAPAEPALRQALPAAPGRGFPLVAALYVTGSGDEVPLEFRARHLARFEWPRGREEENAIVAPYVRARLEGDLVRTGRPALRILAEALAEDAPSEARAMEVVRIILRIGGRGAADSLAPLLERERDLGGVRVCEIAAGALLYLGRQDLLLRAPSPEALVRAARGWWETAKDQPESEWTREAVRSLAGRWEPKDTEGVREVLELLVGETIGEPGEWRAKNPDWRPPPPPVHPEEWIPRLAQGRAPAYAANRALEEATGMRLLVPVAGTLGELRAALRLWRPPSDLEVRWRRVLESRNVRLSIAVVGYQPRRGTNHLLWHHETTEHCTEDPTGKLEFVSGDEAYLLYVHALDQGTRLLYGEYHESGTERRTVLRRLSAGRTAVIFSAPFKAVVVVSVEEAPGRRTPRSPDELWVEVRGRLRRLAEISEGAERRRALRALGYCQDRLDLAFLKEQRAAEALLLQGDPAGMEGGARLEPYEVDMALRKAEDPGLRDFLERMKKTQGAGER